MPAVKQSDRIKQAEDLGFKVGWQISRPPGTAALFHSQLTFEWIEVTSDGDWCHVRREQGSERTIWDSGASRVRPKSYKRYLISLLKLPRQGHVTPSQ